MTSVGQQRETRASREAGWFATTHWSVVLSAGQRAAPGAGEALEKLCRTYWYPLYAYVRRQGRGPEEAEDLTQEFFAHFLEKNYVSLAERERGRFRTFLLTSLKHFLIKEWARASAQKRGAGRDHIPLDTVTAESLYRRELSHNLSAEKVYERNWALTVLQEVRRKLAQEYAAGAKGQRFAHLEQFLAGQKGGPTYGEVASRLGVAEGTVKSDVNRLRKRFRELLRAEIAHTVSNRAEINEELRYLIAVVSEG